MATSPATGNSPASIAVRDFNGDGISDLAVGNENSNTVTVLLTDTQTATASTSGVALPVLAGTHQVAAS
jgi:hypothetical protein